MSTKRTENLIFKMMTENTGSALCDSGGAYGRHWQRNQKKTLKDFQNMPEATADLEIVKHKDSDERFEMSVTLNLFHFLKRQLDIDEVCDAFNRKKVQDRGSTEFYGVSTKGEAWITERFKPSNGEKNFNAFNSYNDESNLSQVIQGCELEHIESGDKYLLLQIHNGCDVRGGYTDAKLFKIDCEYFGSEDAFFESFDFMAGEFVDHQRGAPLSNEEIKSIVLKHAPTQVSDWRRSVTLHGDIYVCGQ